MPMADYVGASAFGLKMGVVSSECDLTELILERIGVANRDGMLDSNDVLCVTESLVARTQGNYVTTAETAAEIQSKLHLGARQKVGVLFPIASRNRFSLVLEGIALAVPDGEVVVQLSYPRDEMGNRILSDEQAECIRTRHGGCLDSDYLKEGFAHALTGVDYVRLYKDIIARNGARPTVLLSNDPLKMLESQPDAVIVADIHTKQKHLQMIQARFANACTLQEFFNQADGNGRAWSEFGLLGSNLSGPGRLKLAPRRADQFACTLQAAILKATGKNVEVLVNGDGAYKDPTSGIYELADPRPALGATPGVQGRVRSGVKYKYLVDMLHGQGKSHAEIEQALAREMDSRKGKDDALCEGTTPRRMEDLLASLADLVSGSADAGTPLVLIKGIYR